ncbi:phage major capsid protein [Paraconexibacter antarcticus]|uniref:Phage major capsid protein n=1 Tax=Paraconexibacter antarcticus TaxID=2949664 RepID=A0ABY5DWE2_9ACTN|nr:phage major capsid protein [Paraconexibacter antarcticus]UTI65608.1 phage major capsid protein [Paraconexibacter antarcticus]
MATQTLATADAILKDLYRGPIIEQLNYKTYMLDMIERDSESVDFTGRRAIFPVHSAPNFSPTSFGDGGGLATPGTQGYQDGIVGIKYHNAGIELTDQSIRQANGDNAGAFVNLLDNDTKLLAQDMKKNLNRQIFGDGTGLITAVTAGGAGTNNVTVSSTQYLRPGAVVDVLVRASGASVTASTSVVIQSINRATKVVTFTTTITGTTDNTFGLYLPGARTLELEAGLRNVAATNRTLHGINSATAGNEFWNSSQRDAASAVAGESIFEQLADDIGGVGQGEVEVFLTTRGIRRRLADTYQSQKRFVDAKAVEIHGGYQSIFVNEIPVIADDDCPKGYAFALRKPSWKWFELAAPDWLKSKDGSVWQLANSAAPAQGSLIGRRAAWQAWFIWYASLACMAPNQTGAIINAADDAAVNY